MKYLKLFESLNGPPERIEDDRIDFPILTKLHGETYGVGDEVLATFFTGGFDTYRFRIVPISQNSENDSLGYIDDVGQMCYDLDHAYHVVRLETYNDFASPEKRID